MSEQARVTVDEDRSNPIILVLSPPVFLLTLSLSTILVPGTNA